METGEYHYKYSNKYMYIGEENNEGSSRLIVIKGEGNFIIQALLPDMGFFPFPLPTEGGFNAGDFLQF